MVDANGDQVLDPAVGHARFIKGIIERIAPVDVETVNLLDPLGAVDDAVLATAIRALELTATAAEHPAILNLSLSGYAEDDSAPPVLAAAVKSLQDAGWLVVASAGNDATCRFTWPAALPGVVAVAAVGPFGPAWFSNHGDWVDACAPGVDIVSNFPVLTFAGTGGTQPAPEEIVAGPVTQAAIQLAGDGQPEPADLLAPITVAGGLKRTDTVDADVFESGWARWSGTSFSAPAVVGALARHIGTQTSPEGTTLTSAELYERALAELIDDPALMRIPGFGTVVNVA
jgi:subtilisin family serine protease